MLNDFLSLVFPTVCYACGKGLYKTEDCICTRCLYHLPRTNFHLFPDNPVIRLFWGRVPVQAASSLYSFSKGGKVQRLIHQLKYRGKKEIGLSLGKYYGRELNRSPAYSGADLVVPVPLHITKHKRRGYNQSEFFARGLAETMGADLHAGLLVRTALAETQTRRSRFLRWKNAEHGFKVTAPEKLAGKHILLADDVVTTGSTLEACARPILQVPGTRISVVTIATTTAH